MKYSDLMMDWLSELGYTHCFFVAGGNVMHLLESASRRFRCIPVVHEVSAGIATEYLNEASSDKRAFALVTAGPGLTNVMTAMGGAYLESRELLVIGGQVKVPDLNGRDVRQRGIQEIDGVDIARPVAVRSERLDAPLDRGAFTGLAQAGSVGRKGPVFIEIPLDVQARDVDADLLNGQPAFDRSSDRVDGPSDDELERLAARLRDAQRPVLLIGGGVSRQAAVKAAESLKGLGVPVMTTWNGADRIASDHPLYFGRPNTWGQRHANLLMQQADLLVALGTRLGLQQTGFNWREFVPQGDVVQVDCDQAELEKGHPNVAWPIRGDADRVLLHLAGQPVDGETMGRREAWVTFCREVTAALPLREAGNECGPGFVQPYEFCQTLSGLCRSDDTVIPCSSGSAFTVMMQAFLQKQGQTIITNKGLASMGYGLGGAIGAAFAAPDRRTILVEGDGGFSQNLQEVGTAAVNGLNLKIFIFDDSGYASIRMTQRNYFGGRYVGCDLQTGLGLPDWETLFAAYKVPALRLTPGFADDPAFLDRFNQPGPAAFLVPIDPEQTYFPKISSRIVAGGGMESNPLHLMSPFLDDALMERVGRYLKD